MTAAAEVPSANRGLKGGVASGSDAESLCIDFLTFSADLQALIDTHAHSSVARLLAECLTSGTFLDRVAAFLFGFFFEGTAEGLRLDEEVRGFRNFYANHCRLFVGDQQVGFIAFGGKHTAAKDSGSPTFCVELTGAGCAHVKAWAQLKAKLQSAGARLSRVDVAWDDFRGVHNLDEGRRLYEAGAFVVNGRPPVLSEVHALTLKRTNPDAEKGTPPEYAAEPDKSGRTIYIGKNAGNQQLCVYEKGKQLGDPESPWVRWEGRFGSKYREIPLEILTDSAAFFVGHFPALSWIEATARRMATHVKRAQAGLVKAMRWCRHQYGGLLELLRRHTDQAEFAQVVGNLTRQQLPKWACDVPHAALSRPAAVRSLLAA